MERFPQARDLSNYFMRPNINQTPAPSNKNNNNGQLQQTEQRPGEIVNINPPREAHNSPEVTTPSGTQPRHTTMLRRSPHRN